VLTVAQVFELADLVGWRPAGNIRRIASDSFRLRYRTTGDMVADPRSFGTRDDAGHALWGLAMDGTAHVEQDDRLRALILLSAFASLRWGEVIALRRQDVDCESGTVRVRRQYLEMDSGNLVLGPPKSRAGSRTVVIPAAILPAIRSHLERYTAPDADALVFTGSNGGILRQGNFRRAARWAEAVAEIGAPNLHFHDLRHTGNTIAAQSGASLRDLMARMGQDSVRAAMIYQHATSEAGRAIADALNDRIQAAKTTGDDEDEGPASVLVPTG
jgi:integrase